MRNWYGLPRKHQRPPLPNGVYESFSLARPINTAELLLTPIDYRKDFRPPSAEMNATASSSTIPLEEVLLVERFPCHSKLQLTTVSSGTFELSSLTTNGHDMLLAFLQASLQPHRISLTSGPCSPPHLQESASSSSCLDFDTVQARHMYQRTAHETWPEKLSRRLGHALHNLTELSVTLCDGACCTYTESREPPPRRDYMYGMDLGDPVREPNRLYHLPSGLSVEPEPEATFSG